MPHPPRVLRSLGQGGSVITHQSLVIRHSGLKSPPSALQTLIRPRRFVVRVAGDSMEPTLHLGQYLVFEYHRSPRREGEIVIANIPAFGPATDGTEAIKRIRQSPTHWIFESDNPDYAPFSVSKEELSHPILGGYVGAL